MDAWLNPPTQYLKNPQLDGWFSNYCGGLISNPLDFTVCEIWFWVNKDATNGTFEPPYYILNQPYGSDETVKPVISQYINGVVNGSCPEYLEDGSNLDTIIAYLNQHVSNETEPRIRAVFAELVISYNTTDGSRNKIYPCILFPKSVPNCTDASNLKNQNFNAAISQSGILPSTTCTPDEFWCNLFAKIDSALFWLILIVGLAGAWYLYEMYAPKKKAE